MWKADKEEQQSSTEIAREVAIMWYNENYQPYNVQSVNSHIVMKTSIKFVKNLCQCLFSVTEPVEPRMFMAVQWDPHFEHFSWCQDQWSSRYSPGLTRQVMF